MPKRYKPFKAKPKRRPKFKEAPPKVKVVSQRPTRNTRERYPSKVTTQIDQTPKPPRQEYTGTYIIGLATMHKSNIVPVTSKEAATDVAKMRRN